jgi:hypothetical protein
MKPRRILAIALVVLGGLLLFLAPETVGGLALMVLGVVIEIAGITLERRV